MKSGLERSWIFATQGSSDLESRVSLRHRQLEICNLFYYGGSDRRHCINVYFSEQVVMSKPEVVKISQKSQLLFKHCYVWDQIQSKRSVCCGANNALCTTGGYTNTNTNIQQQRCFCFSAINSDEFLVPHVLCKPHYILKWS